MTDHFYEKNSTQQYTYVLTSFIIFYMKLILDYLVQRIPDINASGTCIILQVIPPPGTLRHSLFTPWMVFFFPCCSRKDYGSCYISVPQAFCSPEFIYVIALTKIGPICSFRVLKWFFPLWIRFVQIGLNRSNSPWSEQNCPDAGYPVQFML